MSTQCFPFRQATSDTKRLLIPSRKQELPATAESHQVAVRTVKVDYDRFLDFHVDSVEKWCEGDGPVINR